MAEVLVTALVVVVALGVSAAGGYPITVLVLRRADRGRNDDAGSGGRSGDVDEIPDAAHPDPADVLRGGTWIGILERLAITGAILTAYPAAIAVVVAIKGLGRFPELRAATGVSERFIIGTLTSGLWAAAVGVAALGAMGAVG